MSEANKNFKKVICTAYATFIFLVNAQSVAVPKEPGNAALLYYQAFLLQPEPDNATFWSFEEVTKGADPNESDREYLNRPFSRATIELAQNATQIPLCDWGPLYPGGYGHNALLPSLQRLCTLMQVYALNLAVERDFRSALENCIGLQKLANHIGDETFLMFSTSRMVNERALACIRYVLGSMPLDIETLTWLRDRLEPSSVAPARIVKILKSNCSLHLQYMRDHPKAYSYWWKEYPEAIQNENTRKEILEKTSILYGEHLQTTLRIISSDLPYERKKMEIKKLITRIESQIENKNDDNHYDLILGDCISYIESCYNIMVRDTANFNALSAALGIYLVTARTGHIPKSMPGDQAKDPYSDKDFEYKVTDEGFALRYQDNDGQWGKSRWLEFKFHKQGEGNTGASPQNNN